MDLLTRYCKENSDKEFTESYLSFEIIMEDEWQRKLQAFSS